MQTHQIGRDRLEACKPAKHMLLHSRGRLDVAVRDLDGPIEPRLHDDALWVFHLAFHSVNAIVSTTTPERCRTPSASPAQDAGTGTRGTARARARRRRSL